MINLSTSGNAVVFTFTDSDRYLYGTGTITVPLNSLLLVTDNSQMATFKKAASNDVFVSALYSELGMTKDELISWFETNAVGSTGGGGGITSGDVQTMIDESISGKVDTSAFDTYSAATNTELNNKLIDVRSNSATYAGNGVTTIDISKNGSSYTTRTYVASINNQPILTGSDYTKANKFSLVETSAITQSVTSASTDSEIPSAKAVWDAIPASITVDSAFDSGSTNPLANSAITDHLNTVESVIATSLVDLDNRKLDASAYTPTDLSNYYTKSETSGATQISTALNAKADTATTYTKTEVDNAITAATSTKQDTLVAGDNIIISGNVISASGGGASYEAGTNISITNDTINCTLPITASTSVRKNDVAIGNDIVNGASDYYRMSIGNGNKFKYNNSKTSNSILIGTASNNSDVYNTINASRCIAIGGNGIEVGYDNTNGYGSIGIGYGVKSLINESLAIGYNTVASGTTKTNINNQLTIDTSNQVYVYDKDNTAMVKLQDYMQYKIAKVTQAEYDALVQGGTVDANTVYFITSSNS